jgi:hypothetical protein
MAWKTLYTSSGCAGGDEQLDFRSVKFECSMMCRLVTRENHGDVDELETTNPSVAQYDRTPIDLAVNTRDDEVRLCTSVLFLGALVLALADRLGCANDGWTGCNCCDDAEDHVSGARDEDGEEKSSNDGNGGILEL